MWTKERIELLKQFWADGLSASQIAGRLGGITRNAIIGKVHRLGLPGRATTLTTRSPRRRHRLKNRPNRPAHARRARGLPSLQFGSHGNTALKPVFAPVEQRAVALTLVPVPVEELNVPSALRVDLLDLKECMCRWPIGHPKEDGFHFCGRQKAAHGSYCAHHARIAFQPDSRRNK